MNLKERRQSAPKIEELLRIGMIERFRSNAGTMPAERVLTGFHMANVMTKASIECRKRFAIK